MSGFNILGLNEDYEIVQPFKASNLQWNRKYHESGNFILQIPPSQFSNDVKYIYTNDRPEMGIIKKKTYLSVKNKSYIILSGPMLESELSRMIVYPKGDTNITNSPSWEYREGNAEDVAFAFFNAFKRLETSSIVVDIGIDSGTSQGRGSQVKHYRNGEQIEDLGYKIYDILKPSGMSWRISYDLDDNTRVFNVWSGKDRTQDNTGGNNPVVFSTKFGNITKPNIVLDETDYKNGCIVIHETVNNDVSSFTVRVVFNDDTDDRNLTYLRSGLNKSEYTTQQFYEAMDQEGENELKEDIKTINLEFDAMPGSYVYREDFDLGDLCSIEIAEMGITADMRLIGCYEVMKEGKWKMSMEFGTPINLHI